MSPTDSPLQPVSLCLLLLHFQYSPLHPKHYVRVEQGGQRTRTRLWAPAAEHYGAVRDALLEVAELFPWLDGNEQGMRANVEDADRRAQAAFAVQKAKTAEESGLVALQRALAAIM